MKQLRYDHLIGFRAKHKTLGLLPVGTHCAKHRLLWGDATIRLPAPLCLPFCHPRIVYTPEAQGGTLGSMFLLLF